MSKIKQIEMPCNTTVSNNRVTGHIKKCKVCSSIVDELLNGTKYDNILRDIIKNHTSISKTIKKDIDSRIMFLPNSIFRTLVDTIYSKKRYLIPEEWKYECVCGFRCNENATIAAHKAKCDVYHTWWKHIKDTYLTLDKLNEELIINQKTIWEYCEEIFGKDNKNLESLYLKTKREIETYIENGQLDYKPLHVSQLMKNDHIKKRYQQSLQEKYGENVTNISQVKYIKEKISKTHKKIAYKANIKRKETLMNKYGVTNVSQLDSVKSKKQKTFKKNYGVDNIFKRPDLIVKAFQRKVQELGLNITNPMFLKNAISDNVRQLSTGVYYLDYGQLMFLSPAEEKVFQLFMLHKDKYQTLLNPESIHVNKVVLISDNQDESYWVDILIKDTYPIEIRQALEYVKPINLNKPYRISKQKKDNFIQLKLDVDNNTIAFFMDLKNEKRKYYYLVNNNYKHIITKCKNFTSKYEENSDIEFVNLQELGVSDLISATNFLLNKINKHHNEYTKQFKWKVIEKPYGKVATF